PQVSVCFILFGCIWDSLVALQNLVQNGPNWCKSSCHEVESEFFVTNAPDPPHWTLKSRLCVFCTVWMPYKTRFKMSRSGEKVCAMKTLRNFSQRSIRSTPLDPNLMFRCVLYYLGAFGTVW